MFSESLAHWLVWILHGYGALGILFALAFVSRGVGSIDPDAGSGTLGFRVVIFPGCAAFWPLLLHRWRGGGGTPARERNAHRDSAEGRRGEGGR